MKKNRYVIEKGITTSDAAYATGDQIGPLLALDNAYVDGVGLKLSSLTVIDKGDQKPSMDILFFDDEPVVASSDNGAVDITGAELEKCLGIVSLTGSDFKTIKAATNAVITKAGIELVLKNKRTLPNKANTLWVLVVSRGTPDWTAGENLKLKLGLEAN